MKNPKPIAFEFVERSIKLNTNTAHLKHTMMSSSELSIASREKKGGYVIGVQDVELQSGFISKSLDLRQREIILGRCGHGVVEEQDLADISTFPPEVQYMVEKIEELKINDAVQHLKDALLHHQGDANFPSEVYALMEELVQGHEASHLNEEEWEFQCKLEAGLIVFHSPYPEIRAVTDPVDDLTIPIETIRAYFLGLIWTIIGAGVNEFFMHRKPAISLKSPMIQVMLYPCGKLLAKVLPDWGFTVRGTRHSLNPGPWTYKEQMFATIIFNVAIPYTYVSHNIYMQKLPVFFPTPWIDFGYQFLLMASSQLLGFGLVSLVRRFCVYEQRCIWPTLLPTLSLNRALLKPEKKEVINGWKISKYNFFLVCFCGMFLYNWFPTFIFEALSTFSWITWIAPNNFNLATVTGSQYGLGFNPWVTFDWNIVDYNFALTIPFFSQLNQYIGTFIGFFVVLALFKSNYKWTGFLPINNNAIYDNKGKKYVSSKILDANSMLDEKKYQDYSPPFYTAGNLLVYGAYFAIYPFTFCYTVVQEFSTIKMGMIQFYKNLRNLKRSTYAGFNDPHATMMKKYKEVPDWYYFAILVVSIALAIICIKVYPAQTPVWGIFFILGLNLVFLVPITIILATTGFSLTMNVLTELIIGYALPGNALALNTLKSLSHNIDSQAESYIADQKLAHYAKIPPMAIFRGQLVSSTLQVFVALGVINWQIENVENICTSKAANKFSCPKELNFYSSATFWGVIGPKRVFNGLYPVLQYCFLIGFLLVFPCLLAKRYFPRVTKYFEPVLIIGGLYQYAPYNLSYVTTGLYFSFFFMYYVRRKYTSWWEKYNFVLTASFSAAVAFSAVIIFFSVNYHPKKLNWWGNTVITKGVDGGEGRQTLLNVTLGAIDGYFGPRSGSYP